MSREAVPARPARADARHNIDRIVAAATSAFLGDRADVSLEEIARRANVGSATLHRHFPTRLTLLETVFHEQVDTLCARAESLAQPRADADVALVDWLCDLSRFVSSTRGIAAALLLDLVEAEPDSPQGSCRGRLETAGGELLEQARAAGAVRADVEIGDLLDLVNALSSVPGRGQEQAERLVLFALEGRQPR